MYIHTSLERRPIEFNSLCCQDIHKIVKLENSVNNMICAESLRAVSGIVAVSWRSLYLPLCHMSWWFQSWIRTQPFSKKTSDLKYRFGCYWNLLRRGFIHLSVIWSLGSFQSPPGSYSSLTSWYPKYHTEWKKTWIPKLQKVQKAIGRKVHFRGLAQCQDWMSLL